MVAFSERFLFLLPVSSNTPLHCLISFCFSFSPSNYSFLPNFVLHLSLMLPQIFSLLPLLWILKGHKNFPFSFPKLFVYLSPPHYNKIILPFRCHLNLALSPSTPSFSPGLKTDQHFLNWKSHNNIFSIENTTSTVFPLNIPQEQCFHWTYHKDGVFEVSKCYDELIMFILDSLKQSPFSLKKKKNSSDRERFFQVWKKKKKYNKNKT